MCSICFANSAVASLLILGRLRNGKMESQARVWQGPAHQVQTSRTFPPLPKPWRRRPKLFGLAERKQKFVSNRSYDKAVALAEATGGRAIRFDDWEQQFRDLDILVSSTAAPHAVVTSAKIEPILRMRRDRPLFIIDLAIPRDVEPTVLVQSLLSVCFCLASLSSAALCSQDRGPKLGSGC
jgi:Shikimate / quinate 5-dehydrogenase